MVVVLRAIVDLPGSMCLSKGKNKFDLEYRHRVIFVQIAQDCVIEVSPLNEWWVRTEKDRSVQSGLIYAPTHSLNNFTVSFTLRSRKTTMVVLNETVKKLRSQTHCAGGVAVLVRLERACLALRVEATAQEENDHV